jgi:hypothetical protein
MGYTTEFSGQIECVPPLNEAEVAFINQFTNTRKVVRRKAQPSDGLEFIENEDTGELLKGSYFTTQQAHDYYGQNTANIVEHNNPPLSCPGLWCQWMANEEGHLEWNGAEKFYASPQWMVYLIEHFLQEKAHCKFVAPKTFAQFQAHTLNGVIYASGEDTDDIWRLIVKDNVVYTQQAKSEVLYNIFEQCVADRNSDIEITHEDGEYTDEFYDSLYDIKSELDYSLLKDEDWEDVQKVVLNKNEEEITELEMLYAKNEKNFLDTSLTKTTEEKEYIKL